VPNIAPWDAAEKPVGQRLVLEVAALLFIPNGWSAGLFDGKGDCLDPYRDFCGYIPLSLPQVTATSMLFGGSFTALLVMAVFLSMFRQRVLMPPLSLSVDGMIALALIFRALPITVQVSYEKSLMLGQSFWMDLISSLWSPILAPLPEWFFRIYNRHRRLKRSTRAGWNRFRSFYVTF
jgi:hypothetical protein